MATNSADLTKNFEKELFGSKKENDEKAMPLIEAIKENDQEEFFRLLNLKTDRFGKRFIDEVDEERKGSPLYWAASLGYVHFIEPLLQAGADINKQDKDSRTPVYVATENGHTRAIAALSVLGENEANIAQRFLEIDKASKTKEHKDSAEISSSQNSNRSLIFNNVGKIKSVIDKNYEISKGLWVVSIVNTKGNNLVAGHAVIVLEGLDSAQKHFINQYDMTSNSPENMPGQSSFNEKGYITKIRCYEYEENRQDYSNPFPHRSYYISPERAEKMIDAIKREAELTKVAMSNLSKPESQKERDENGKIIELLRYQKLGRNPLVLMFGNTEHGNNCAGWCQEKMDIATERGYKPKPPTAPSMKICRVQ